MSKYFDLENKPALVFTYSFDLLILSEDKRNMILFGIYCAEGKTKEYYMYEPTAVIQARKILGHAFKFDFRFNFIVFSK